MVTTINQAEANSLEQDALEVLNLVGSVKNSLAPINWIPPEILSFIPDYYDQDGTGQDLLALTHICRSWRGMFVSRPLCGPACTSPMPTKSTPTSNVQNPPP